MILKGWRVVKLQHNQFNLVAESCIQDTDMFGYDQLSTPDLITKIIFT